MKSIFKTTLAIAAVAAAGHSIAQVTVFQNENYQGDSVTASQSVENFRQGALGNGAASVVVTSETWEVCDRIRYNGKCMVLRPGQYPSLAAMGLSERVASMRAIGRYDRIDESRYAPVAAAVPTGAQVVFFEGENFQGRSFSAQSQVDDFSRFGFNDLATSVVVLGDQWEICENARFNGRCVVLRPGRYDSLASMGMSNRVSSVRGLGVDARISNDRYAPLPTPVYDNRRRNGERLYEANVTSVRAVVGAPEQRCWMEPQSAPAPVVQQNSNAKIGGAIAGALIGGILGHQVGGGSGKDIATVGGVVAGAALGSNIGGRYNTPAAQPVAAPDVQRCTTQPSQAKTEFWDVVYTFRGQEHRVQMTSQPGATVTVNGQGEPRA